MKAILPLKKHPVIGVVCALAGLGWGERAAGADAPVTRQWTDHAGRKIDAAFIKWVNGRVHLRNGDGREIEVPFEQFSPADRILLRSQFVESPSMPADSSLIPWPRRVSVGPDIPLTGSGRLFETPNFEIHTDADVPPEYMTAVAEVFESTLAAVSALPMDLRPHPPSGMPKFRALFTDRAKFDSVASGEARAPIPGQKVQGLYRAPQREVWVPYSAFEASAGRRRATDANTLIHEITHQVLHDRLLTLPYWMTEGLSEYVASIPYEKGSFDFTRSVEGLKEILRLRYRVDQPRIQHPADLFQMDVYETWGNTMDDYLAAMLSVYFFVHLDGDGRAGRLTRCFATLEAALNGSNRLVDEHNEALRRYQADIDAYNAAIEKHNQAVKAYNEQVSSGAKRAVGVTVVRQGDGKVSIGGGTQPPVKPAGPPEMPAILRINNPQAPTEIIKAGKRQAALSLLGNRDFDGLADEMRRAFATIGLSIDFQPPKATEAGLDGGKPAAN